MRTSARNQFVGEVADVKHGAVNDEILLRANDGLEIVAVITHGSAASLGLAAGKAVVVPGRVNRIASAFFRIAPPESLLPLLVRGHPAFKND